MGLIIRSLVGAAVVAVLTGFAPAPVAAEDVFVRIAAPLDEARGLCLDIPGHRDRVNVTRPLVVHTCKWDIWNFDERFDAEALDQGALRMPTYDLCAGVDRATQGSAIVLGSCDGEPLHRWQVGDGRFRLVADPNMCLTVGAEPSRLTPGGRRLPSRHVARSLSLEPCRDAANERQIWQSVSPTS
ncbi:MAG: hypothetical protein GKS02_01855 [Alphaproteobacteria bacterium]|nr:hypothetical protein [Alphaproteobacteria bacterium]